MSSVIVRTTTGPLAALLMLVSVIALLRGHDQPGGGFIAGMVMASAWALHLMAFGAAATRTRMIVSGQGIIACGLALVAFAAVFPMFLGDAALQAQWWVTVPGVTKVGTVLLFDVGVYFTVWGAAMVILFSLSEDT